MLYYLHIKEDTNPLGFSKCHAYIKRIRFSRQIVEETQYTRRNLTLYKKGIHYNCNRIANRKSVFNNQRNTEKDLKEMKLTQTLRDTLKVSAEEKYKQFHQSLVPGLTNMLGVRMPKIRELAKWASKQD